MFKILFQNLSLDLKDLLSLGHENCKGCQKEDDIFIISSQDNFNDAVNLMSMLGKVRHIVLKPIEISDLQLEMIIEDLKYNKSKINFIPKRSTDELIHILNKQENLKHAEVYLDTKITLFTSGTTGTPKANTHSLNNLSKTYNKTLSKDFIWGLTYQISRMAGLQVLLNAFYSDNKIAITSELSSTEVIKSFIGWNVDAISATPSKWREFISIKSSRSLKLKQITLGGEIADQNILTKLSEIFNDAKIVHVYASTEVGVGFSVSDRKEGFPKEYLNNTSKKFPKMLVKDNKLLFEIDKKIFDSGDLVMQSGDRFLFLGRASGVINIGGNKILPEVIEDVIRKIKIVRNVKVFPMKHNFLGNVVHAIIEPKNIQNLDEENILRLKKMIRNHCLETLPKHGVPVKIDICKIELSAAGKIKR